MRVEICARHIWGFGSRPWFCVVLEEWSMFLVFNISIHVLLQTVPQVSFLWSASFGYDSGFGLRHPLLLCMLSSLCLGHRRSALQQ